MAQPQQQAPQRAFSPPQHSPSPANSQSGFALPPTKRVRTDGPPSQPGSPYPASPYAGSPGAVNTPPANAASPAFSPTSTVPAQNYQSAYTNGHPPSGLNLPNAQSANTSPVTTPRPLQASMTQYATATMAPITHNAAPSAPATPTAPGTMGPPQRPAERQTKEYEYEVTDSLAGTGIDLRAEEQYMSDIFWNGLEGPSDARTGFPQFPPGSKASFYGAGPANQPGQPAVGEDQKEQEAQAAKEAWTKASMRLGSQRTMEINDPFLLVSLLHSNAERVAKEHSLGLNLEVRNNAPTMGRMRLPEQFPQPSVTVKTHQGPDSTMVTTTGSYIPHDAYLADQLALISLATKQRIRDLLQDASVIAVNRQKTSHGEIPDEWQPAAAPVNAEPLGEVENGGMEMDVDGVATDTGTNPLKRSADDAGLDHHAKIKKLAKISSYMTTTMRDLAKQEREWEEARLRRRQKRKDGPSESMPTPSRSNSIAPGTPGSVAPDPEKTLTKKEQKKSQAAKAAEAHSHANQNLTSSMFAGFGGKLNPFGKKKTGKTYDWMNAGRGGSGTSTPTKAAGGSRAGGGGTDSPGGGSMALTNEGRNRLGGWREDKEKGVNIQLRDWVAVLERDGRETKALQHAYDHLGDSLPR